MKKLFLLLILAAAPAYGQTFLQRTASACAVGSPGVSTVTCSLPKATTTGSTIRIIEIDRSTATTGRTASSFKGTALTGISLSGTAGTTTVFVGPSDGSQTFTVKLPNVYNPMVYVQEDTWSATIDVKTPAGTGAINKTPQPITTANFTTTVAGDYALFMCEDSYGAGGLAPTGAWSAFNVSGVVPGGYSTQTLGVAGSYAGTGTLAAGLYTWTCSAVAFKPSGNTPPPPPPPNQTCTGTATLMVNGTTVPPLSMSSTFTMPSATVRVNYSASIATSASVTGGVSPYTYAILSGSLPSGLTMNTAGIISGAPGTAGTFSFTVQVTDSSGSAMNIDFQQKVELAERLRENYPPPCSGSHTSLPETCIGVPRP